MHWNANNFSEYGQTTDDYDYSHPTYYEQETTSSPHSGQPVQSLDADPDSLHNATPVGNYDHYDPAVMSPYRSPTHLDGYTADVGAEQREAAERGHVSEGKKRKGLAGLGGLGVAIGTLLLKIKTVLLFLLNLKWLAIFGKFGFAGITAIISVVAYSFLFGWPFAIGLVALLFLHEMGHAIVMKLKGIPVGGMIFIPMLGAAVFMNQMPKNAKDEAEVGIAGPIAGAIASSICLLLALQAPHIHSIWAPLAYFGFLMNLFNLIPIVPFDGGRVLAAIDRRVWILGFLGLAAFQIWTWINGNFSPWLLFFVIMAGTQLWARRSMSITSDTKAYYAVPLGERIILSLLYFGLAAVLFFGMTISHNLILSWISIQ